MVGHTATVAAEHDLLGVHERRAVARRGDVRREKDVAGLVPDLQHGLAIGGLERGGEPRAGGGRGRRNPLGPARSPHRDMRLVRGDRPRHDRAASLDATDLPAIGTPGHVGQQGDLSIQDAVGGAAASGLDVRDVPDPHLAILRADGQPRAVGAEGDRKGHPGARGRRELEDLLPRSGIAQPVRGPAAADFRQPLAVGAIRQAGRRRPGLEP